MTGARAGHPRRSRGACEPAGVAGFDRRPLRRELSAQPGKPAGRRHSGTSEASRGTRWLCLTVSDRTSQRVTAPIPLPKSDRALNAARRTDGATPASRIPGERGRVAAVLGAGRAHNRGHLSRADVVDLRCGRWLFAATALRGLERRLRWSWFPRKPVPFSGFYHSGGGAFAGSRVPGVATDDLRCRSAGPGAPRSAGGRPGRGPSQIPPGRRRGQRPVRPARR
jgi:hypothetical protein